MRTIIVYLLLSFGSVSLCQEPVTYTFSFSITVQRAKTQSVVTKPYIDIYGDPQPETSQRKQKEAAARWEKVKHLYDGSPPPPKKQEPGRRKYKVPNPNEGLTPQQIEEKYKDVTPKPDKNFDPFGGGFPGGISKLDPHRFDNDRTYPVQCEKE